jgi:hypothetical protein
MHSSFKKLPLVLFLLVCSYNLIMNELLASKLPKITNIKNDGSILGMKLGMSEPEVIDILFEKGFNFRASGTFSVDTKFKDIKADLNFEADYDYMSHKNKNPFSLRSLEISFLFDKKKQYFKVVKLALGQRFKPENHFVSHWFGEPIIRIPFNDIVISLASQFGLPEYDKYRQKDSISGLLTTSFLNTNENCISSATKRIYEIGPKYIKKCAEMLVVEINTNLGKDRSNPQDDGVISMHIHLIDMPEVYKYLNNKAN